MRPDLVRTELQHVMQSLDLIQLAGLESIFLGP